MRDYPGKGYAHDQADMSIDPEAAHDGPVGHAEASLSEAHLLHKQLDELEMRLFGPEPRPLAANQTSTGDANEPMGSPPLAHTLRHASQRLSSATSRVARILGRL